METKESNKVCVYLHHFTCTLLPRGVFWIHRMTPEVRLIDLLCWIAAMRSSPCTPYNLYPFLFTHTRRFVIVSHVRQLLKI